MGYGLFEAMELEDLTPGEVKRELKRHGATWAEFTADLGERETYTGEEVLSWLGY